MAIADRVVVNIANALQISRAVFADAFNAETPMDSEAEFLSIASELDRHEPMAAGPDKDRRDYLAALRRANSEGWLVAFVLNRFGDLMAGQSENDPLRAELHSIVSKAQGFPEGLQVTQGALAAMRRACLILKRTRDQDGDWVEENLGSGFLVGPHLVLTNYHVVKTLLKADGTPLQNGPELCARFDYHAHQRAFVPTRTYRARQGVEGWLVTHSPDLPETEAETVASLSQHLDYAIVRLDGRPGDHRGYYSFERLPETPRPGDPLEIWQFPNGRPMAAVTKLCVAAPAHLNFPDGVNTPRIYHNVNAVRGSSGSMILDENKRPVAIHDAGFKAGAPAHLRKNRGIPLAHILDDCLSALRQEIGNVRQSTGWHPERFTPILGRAQLQDHVFEALRGKARIITILTPPRPDMTRAPRLGRSYTRDIIESCVPEGDNHIVVLDASLIDPDAFLTAARLVEAIAPQQIADLPPPGDETTLDAEATGHLVNATLAALRAAAGNKTVWLIIDDIDRHEISTQWPSSSYLIALYRRIAKQGNMRAVLAGLPKRLDGLNDLLDDGILLEEILERAQDRGDCGNWLAAHLMQDLPPDEVAPRLSALMDSLALDLVARRRGEEVATDAPDPDFALIEALHSLIVAHARDAFDRKGRNV
jgi:hypothetical protein